MAGQLTLRGGIDDTGGMTVASEMDPEEARTKKSEFEPQEVFRSGGRRVMAQSTED